VLLALGKVQALIQIFCAGNNSQDIDPDDSQAIRIGVKEPWDVHFHACFRGAPSHQSGEEKSRAGKGFGGGDCISPPIGDEIHLKGDAMRASSRAWATRIRFTFESDPLWKEQGILWFQSHL
jgi:hypothetical protein